METSAASLRVVENTLVEHDRRLISNHDSLAKLRDASAGHNTKIEVITTELRETREDIGDMKKDLAAARAEQREEMVWLRRGAWTAAGTFLLFFVAAASLLLNLSGHG